jgi:hypothetical protein
MKPREKYSSEQYEPMLSVIPKILQFTKQNKTVYGNGCHLVCLFIMHSG